ncbi:hypothetical protein B0G80_3782 [Paraburkholderia sp. BL6669N2]|nr:hypothetical protein B0G80_3782 [Paraburkholderia sp. BL6669N2]
MSKISIVAVKFCFLFILYLGVSFIIKKINVVPAGTVAAVVAASVTVFLGEFFFKLFKCAR